MKKIVATFLALQLLVSMTACGKNTPPDTDAKSHAITESQLELAFTSNGYRLISCDSTSTGTNFPFDIGNATFFSLYTFDNGNTGVYLIYAQYASASDAQKVYQEILDKSLSEGCPLTEIRCENGLKAQRTGNLNNYDYESTLILSQVENTLIAATELSSTDESRGNNMSRILESLGY